MNIWGHFKTITAHKLMVMKGCFRLGMYKQGLLHDMSKYKPVEFFPGCKYYVGTMSPNNLERAEKGYSLAWLHHKGRNKHHLEYWIDYSPAGNHFLTGNRMPERYVAEMFCDRVAASKTYRKELYTDSDPYDYYEKSKAAYMMHPESQALLEQLLLMLKEEGEEATFRYIKRNVLRRGKRKR